MAGSTAKAASKAPQPVSGAAGLGALAKELGPAVPKDADGLGRGDSPLRARLAAFEMELEALKRGSDGGASVADGGQAADLAAALKEQTEALKEALSARTGSNSITTVKTDLVWPTLTDDKSDTKDVVLFYKTSVPWRTIAGVCPPVRSFWPCGPVAKGRGPRLTRTRTERLGRPVRSWTTLRRSISASRIST